MTETTPGANATAPTYNRHLGSGLRRKQDEELQCPHCKRTAAVLKIKAYRERKGSLNDHMYLCQGLDDKGRPLGIPAMCLIPGCTRKPPPDASAWCAHYRRVHGLPIRKEFQLPQLLKIYQKHQIASFEMNGKFGLHITMQSPFTVSREIQGYYKQLEIPFNFEPDFPKVLSKYRKDFT
jgi:hypothetical protein